MSPARNIVLCLDGTWNREDGEWPTNVVRTSRAVAPSTDSGLAQLRYYDRGVGTGRFDRVRGGVVGLGLARNVEQAYVWLSRRYRPGDRIFLFGYSRGAYTARSLAGLIGLCGIADPERCSAAGRQVADTALEGMSIYRLASGPAREDRAALYQENWTRSTIGGGSGSDTDVRGVHFVGVWDTVGSLGLPLSGLRWIAARRHRFHDVSVGDHIRHAYHAVAIDERRRPFAPALWLHEPEAVERVEQVWFPGVHGDVGGGGPAAGLSAGALLWMWSKAWAAGLAFRPESVETVKPDPLGVLSDSLSFVYRVWGSHDRPVGARDGDGEPAAAGEALHWSALRRLEAGETRAYRDGVAGRTVLPLLERGLIGRAVVGAAEEDPRSIAWRAPKAGPISRLRAQA
ncbi:MAG: DUF2235 domain-containing protein [Acidobacteriota bacterium]|nr:DUF2235 domain-containing protein [Acidobacteriota bacterium]